MQVTRLRCHPLRIDYGYSLHDLPVADHMEQETASPRRAIPSMLCLGNYVDMNSVHGLPVLETCQCLSPASIAGIAIAAGAYV